MAHRDRRRFDGQPSLSEHCGHGPIFIAQRSVANDVEAAQVGVAYIWCITAIVCLKSDRPLLFYKSFSSVRSFFVEGRYTSSVGAAISPALISRCLSASAAFVVEPSCEL
jgi:hypothetical protein